MKAPRLATSGAAPGSSLAIPCGILPGAFTTRVTSGIAAAEADCETSRATTFGGITGFTGKNTTGVDTRAASRSGRSIGNAITIAATYP